MKKLLAILCFLGIIGCSSINTQVTSSSINTQVTKNNNSKCIGILEDTTERYSEYLKCMKEHYEESNNSKNNKETTSLEYGKTSVRDYSNDYREARLQEEKNLELEEQKLKSKINWNEKGGQAYGNKQYGFSLEFNRLFNKCERLGFEGGKNIKLCMEREAEYERKLILEKATLAKQNKNYNEEKEYSVLAQILKDIIVAYPEAKARADRENAIRRNAYIKGQNDARASCRVSTSC